MHQPTIRVLEILEAVAKGGGGKRLADFSRELDIPKSTLLPILQTLCQCGYLSQNDMGQYQAGTAMLSLGAAFSANFPAMDFIRGQLEALVDDFQETCYFGILEDGCVLYLDKVDSTQPLRMLIATGRRLPAYATGIGKALLTDMTEADLRKLYPEGIKAMTKNTITDFSQLAAELEDARQNGYAQETEESMEHVRCFAVPVRKRGRIVAAISVAIPVFRYEREKKQHTASHISRTLEATNAEFGLFL